MLQLTPFVLSHAIQKDIFKFSSEYGFICDKDDTKFVNSNIINVQLDDLSNAKEKLSEEPEKCNACKSIKKRHSTCIFCNELSDVYEDFLYEYPNIQNKADTSDHVLFCIDISGSMNTILATLKEACHERLKIMKEQTPQTKVLLVLFSNYVTFLGDCSINQIEFSADRYNMEDLLKRGFEDTKFHNIRPLSESYDNIIRKINSLCVNGSTALGPALAYSIGYLTNKVGSRIFVLTDGVSNVGIGSIESGNKSLAESVYINLGMKAKENGLIVNVIKLTDENCELFYVGKVVNTSNGRIESIKADELKTRLDTMFNSQNILATNLNVTLVVDKRFYVTNAFKPDERESFLTKSIGNFIEINRHLFFQYQVKKDSLKQIQLNSKPYPFQIQIEFLDKEGQKKLRILTKYQKMSNNINNKQNLAITEASLIQNLLEHAKTGNIISSKKEANKLQELWNSEKVVPLQEYKELCKKILERNQNNIKDDDFQQVLNNQEIKSFSKSQFINSNVEVKSAEKKIENNDLREIFESLKKDLACIKNDLSEVANFDVKALQKKLEDDFFQDPTVSNVFVESSENIIEILLSFFSKIDANHCAIMQKEFYEKRKLETISEATSGSKFSFGKALKSVVPSLSFSNTKKVMSKNGSAIDQDSFCKKEVCPISNKIPNKDVNNNENENLSDSLIASSIVKTSQSEQSQISKKLDLIETKIDFLSEFFLNKVKIYEDVNDLKQEISDISNMVTKIKANFCSKIISSKIDVTRLKEIQSKVSNKIAIDLIERYTLAESKICYSNSSIRDEFITKLNEEDSKFAYMKKE